MYGTALARGSVSFTPDFFRSRGAALDAAVFARQGGAVTFAVDPPDAVVYCFRYAECEERLIPLPFKPHEGSASAPRAEPQLRIEAVTDPALSPFEAGDILCSINDTKLALWGDFAKALESGGVNAPVKVELVRGGTRHSRRWVPFPQDRYEEADDIELRPGRVLDTRRQFGFTFVAYPLVFLEDCALRPTSAPAVRLPEGSYLFVFRKPGYADTRYPVHITNQDVTIRTRLLRPDAIPPGFIFVPAGPFGCGGDPDAFQSLPFDEQTLPDYFMSRHEVTFEEYLAFLNDPLEQIDGEGRARPASDEVRAYVSTYLAPVYKRDTIDLLPRWGSKRLIDRAGEGEPWTLTDLVPDPRWPVFDISQLAALEYAHWLTEKKHKDGPWRFALPADLQWEKAARGADRRTFVWGGYPMWCFAWTARGIFTDRGERKTPAAVGAAPADESAYGIRDLTGSVSEHALGETARPFRYQSIRGGNWLETDEIWGRIATRNGRLPEGSSRNTGIRIVATGR
jgi:formylglycine-generating enzyme required for sulfatase activity